MWVEASFLEFVVGDDVATGESARLNLEQLKYSGIKRNGMLGSRVTGAHGWLRLFCFPPLDKSFVIGVR